MARGPKFPGLQQKFERALEEFLAHGQSLKAREIVAAVAADGAKFGITDDERDDVAKNFANYMNRAKTAGMVDSRGPWGATNWLCRLQHRAKRRTRPTDRWLPLLTETVVPRLQNGSSGSTVAAGTATIASNAS